MYKEPLYVFVHNKTGLFMANDGSYVREIDEAVSFKFAEHAVDFATENFGNRLHDQSIKDFNNPKARDAISDKRAEFVSEKLSDGKRSVVDATIAAQSDEIASLKEQFMFGAEKLAAQSAALALAREALSKLADKLDEIDASPEFRGVWAMFMVHGGVYRGPNWNQALAFARQVVAAIDAVKGTGEKG